MVSYGHYTGASAVYLLVEGSVVALTRFVLVLM